LIEKGSNGDIFQFESNTITWAGDSKEIRIHNYVISNPLIYWTTSKMEYCEASYINLNLPIGKPISEKQGALGYWPCYASISPNQRANYLLWLSSGRSVELSDIGYAFLFFYGLEYRGLIEKRDIPIIIQEIKTLLRKFTYSGSFNSYLLSFLAYITSQQHSRTYEEHFSQFFPNPLDLSYDQLLVALAWHSDRTNMGISWETAYSLASMIPGIPEAIITQKLSKQFKHLFEIKFNSLYYPKGLEIEPLSWNYKPEYHPASSFLHPYFHYSKENLIEAVKSIFSIWIETVEELIPVSLK
jgi:hypothetical protein